MVINIPVQVDEERLEDQIAKDYQAKVHQEIVDRVLKVIAGKASYNSYEKVESGIKVMVYNKIDEVLDRYRDEIIDAAASKLAERLGRTKKAREVLEELA